MNGNKSNSIHDRMAGHAQLDQKNKLKQSRLITASPATGNTYIKPHF